MDPALLSAIASLLAALVAVIRLIIDIREMKTSNQLDTVIV